MEVRIMTINVLQAAKYLARKSGWKYSNLELQKILYLCHMLFLGKYDTPLLEGTFEAWMFGPVYPDLYDVLEKYGSKSVPESAFEGIQDLDEKDYSRQIMIFDSMTNQFPHCSAGKLIRITHWKKGAWAKRYNPGTRSLIPNRYIFEEHNVRFPEVST
ncbi:hypothetical protein BO91_01545 [Candidatus Synechococcus spongiarum LMB bulk10E]|nr:hypothetical protein BO91_01545 [Candidatus Synechococcus spongiarum LMB bulk10E]